MYLRGVSLTRKIIYNWQGWNYVLYVWKALSKKNDKNIRSLISIALVAWQLHTYKLV